MKSERLNFEALTYFSVLLNVVALCLDLIWFDKMVFTAVWTLFSMAWVNTDD